MPVFAPEEVRQLIGGGEGFTVEFQGEEREPLHDTELVEAVVCLADLAPGMFRVAGKWPLH